MPSEQQRAILSKGASAWNFWRGQNRSLPIDLKDAELSSVSLRGVDLSNADLAGAHLVDVDLTFSSLARATLRGASLLRSRLISANVNRLNLDNARLTDCIISATTIQHCVAAGAAFHRVHFASSDLSAAKFLDAEFIASTFESTELADVDFSGATLLGVTFSNLSLASTLMHDCRVGRLIFSNVDLSTTPGLDSMFHYGPSTVGVDTLYRSRGQIDQAFLHGCGVPKDVAEYVLPALDDPLQWHSCFISYSSRDERFARALHRCLCENNIRVWFAPEDIKGGLRLRDQLFGAIQLYDKLLLVLSSNSMGSEWVIEELGKALQIERSENVRKLFPLRLCSLQELEAWVCIDKESGLDLAAEVREYFIPDFSGWESPHHFKTAFTRLKADLQPSEVRS